MFTPVVRLAAVLVLLALAIRELGERPVLSAAWFACAACLAYGHFRYGTVWLASRAVRRGDFAKAKSLLGRIRRPDLLRRVDRAHYEYIRGAIDLDEGNAAGAIAHLRSALDGGLHTSNNRCVVACMLAEASLGIGDREGAARYLEIARGLPHKEGLDSAIAAVVEKLATAAVVPTPLSPVRPPPCDPGAPPSH